MVTTITVDKPYEFTCKCRLDTYVRNGFPRRRRCPEHGAPLYRHHKICLECGEPFYVGPKTPNTMFCPICRAPHMLEVSRACAMIHKAGIRTPQYNKLYDHIVTCLVDRGYTKREAMCYLNKLRYGKE